MKDEFLATLSHELRTPLNTILGWSQLMRSRHADPIQLSQGLDVIERNARNQAKIIEDLLDMNRIVSGKIRLNSQAIDLSFLVNDALESVRPAVEAKEIVISKLLDPLTNLIRGDPQRLQQILWNLLANAVKFTPQRGIIQVRLEYVSSLVVLTVSDTGEGISAEFLPHVFERFRQADASTTRKYGGLGLGLSIVKNLVELHGGTVKVESGGVGQGAAFTVTLPIAGAASFEESIIDELSNESIDGECLPKSVTLNGIKVLVVDDEPDARHLLQAILLESGAEVITASSAKDAFRLLANESPHVLVSDIGMPVLDGYELLRKIRALPRDKGGSIMAIAITAFARSEDILLALRAGYYSHLTKPVEGAELVQLIANITRNHIGEGALENTLG